MHFYVVSTSLGAECLHFYVVSASLVAAFMHFCCGIRKSGSRMYTFFLWHPQVWWQNVCIFELYPQVWGQNVCIFTLYPQAWWQHSCICVVLSVSLGAECMHFSASLHILRGFGWQMLSLFASFPPSPYAWG